MKKIVSIIIFTLLIGFAVIGQKRFVMLDKVVAVVVAWLRNRQELGLVPFSSISTMPPPKIHLSTGVNCIPGICVTFCSGHQGYRGEPSQTQPCTVKLAAALI